MTTARSPLKSLRRQSDEMAKLLKEASAANFHPSDTGRLAMARRKPSIVFGVVMDDKVIKLEILWSVIEQSSLKEISDTIIHYMKQSREEYVVN